MNSNFLKLLRPALLAIPFFVFSCNDDKDPVDAEPNVGVVEEDFEINAAYDDADLLTLDILQSSGLGLRTQADADICANAIVTHDEANKKITVDFGAGCTSPNGVMRKGKIFFTYNNTNFLVPGASVLTTFEGYETGGLKIEGSRTITNGGVNIFNKTITLNAKIENGKVTWPDNTFATYASTQSRVITINDESYVASITGNAVGKSREGFDYTTLITSPLIVDQECTRSGVYLPGSGEITFSVLGSTLVANLGDGDCDKLAVVTYPGGSKEITLD